MSMIDKLFAAARAVNAGESLKDPATWKNRQMTMNLVGVIVGVIPQFVQGVDLSAADANAITYGITVLLGVLNTYFTAATSDKVGLSTKK